MQDLAPSHDLCRWLTRERENMKVLIIFNREPYDNTDITWNGLERQENSGGTGSPHLPHERFRGHGTRRMQAVDNYDQDLSAMLKDLISKGVPVKVCGTCMARCGIARTIPISTEQVSNHAGTEQWVTAAIRSSHLAATMLMQARLQPRLKVACSTACGAEQATGTDPVTRDSSVAAP